MRPAKARALVTNAWALQGALLYTLIPQLFQ